MAASSTRQQKLRGRLEQIRQLRDEHKRLRTEAAELAARDIPAAVDAGIPITEIAELSGYTRAAIYTLLNGEKP